MERIKHAMFLLLAVAVSCSVNVGYAFDCNSNTFYTNRDTGNDANMGTELAPFATMQKLVDVMEECIDTDVDADAKTGYVVATQTPYTETTRQPTLDFGGVTFRKGGNSSGERLFLIGLAANGLSHPVINQQLLGSDDNAKPLTGMFIARDGTTPASYITIRNFEITHTSNAGILTDTDGSNGNNIDIIIENNYIHHLFGIDNVGGVRIDFCQACIVRNNVIHDTYQIREETTSNNINNRPAGFHSGVHGYEPAACIIENNLIYNVGRGVFQKQADQDGLDSNVVRRNIFFNIGEAAYSLEIQGAGLAAPQNAAFYENIVANSASAIDTALSGTGNPFGQGNGFNIYNNTIINTYVMAEIQGMTNIRVFNNIRVGVEPSWASSGTAVDFATKLDEGHANSIAYFDYNFYSQHAALWILERNDPSAVVFDSNATWQAAGGNTGLAGNPDANAIFSADAMSAIFNRGDNAMSLYDYSLRASYIALTGGCGVACPVGTNILMGAVASVDGARQMIGPTGGIIGPVFADLDIKTPASISTLSIQ